MGLFRKGWKMKNKHNPGSDEAIKAGCSCPIMDNRYGGGTYYVGSKEPAFWYDSECRYHKGNDDKL